MCGCCSCCCSGRALSGLSATTTRRTTRTRTRTRTSEGKKQFWRKKNNTKVILTAMHQSAPVAGDDDSQEQQIRVNSSFDNDIARLKPPSFGSSSLSSSTFNSSFTTSKKTRTKKNEIVQISSSGKKTKDVMSYYDESHVFDATTILFSLIGFDIFFLVGLTVWVNGLKRRYENAIWKIKRLESEKRDLAVAFNLEKADLVDPLNTNTMNNNRGRRMANATAATVPPSLGGGGGQSGPASANDVLLQGLKAERDALKQALKSVQGELQRYAKENETLENELERALFEVEKLTPID
ncbi:unnamed protein product [Bathycoccus prasinos]